MEERSFEVFLAEAMVDENPVVGNCTDKNRHHHHVLIHGVHLTDVLLLEEVKGEVVRLLDQINSLTGIKSFRALLVWLLH